MGKSHHISTGGTCPQAFPMKPQYSYSQNVFLGPLYLADSSGGYDWTKEYCAPRVQNVNRPSEIFVYAEENMWIISTALGHEFDWSGDVLNDNGIFPWWQTPGSICDSVGSFHKTTWGTMDKRDAGVANAVFADGHTDTMYPWETMKKGSPKLKMDDLPH